MSNILLKELLLENFKCYQKARIPLKPLTVIVGENNAGKSCLIESLRLVSRAAQGAKTRSNYRPAPTAFNLPANIVGLPIDTDKLKFDLHMAIYFYHSSNYAKITAMFSNKSKIEIFINEATAFAIFYDDAGKLIKSKSKAEVMGFDKIAILPQIGPIRENEKLLSRDTVVGDRDTYLASLHFRNEIYLWGKDFFDTFKSLSESTWQGLKINALEYNPAESDYMGLIVRDTGFSAEIGKMGNGLQMWLQVMWFLARSKDANLIILDEPDIYMHPEMQQKILRILQELYPQIIIATHSIEIISSVDPAAILEVDKRSKCLHYATDSASAQKIVDDMGGIQNLSLINIGKKRKCLFVEGKDVSFIDGFHKCLYGVKFDIPTIPYGGFNNIQRVYGSSNLFYSQTSNQIKCFALADRDFRDFRIVEKCYDEAQKQHLLLHVWRRKEIENYLLTPEILYDLIPHKYKISYEDFLNDLDALLEKEHDTVFDSLSSQYRQDCKDLDEKHQQWDNRTCNQEARNFMDTHWTTLEGKLSLVSGKDFFSKLTEYYRQNYHVSLTYRAVMERMTVSLIPEEVKGFLKGLVES